MKKIQFNESEVRELMQDPSRVGIWLEIMRNPLVTIKELEDRLLIKKTTLYYHLNKMQKTRIVLVDKENVPNSNLSINRYSINPDFVEIFSTVMYSEISKTDPKESALFILYIFQSMIDQQIRQIMSLTPEEVSERRKLGDQVNGFLMVLPDNAESMRREVIQVIEKHNKHQPSIPYLERVMKSSHAIVLDFFNCLSRMRCDLEDHPSNNCI